MKPALTLLTALLLAPLASLHAARNTVGERDSRMGLVARGSPVTDMFIGTGAPTRRWPACCDGRRIDAGVGHGIGEWIMY